MAWHCSRGGRSKNVNWISAPLVCDAATSCPVSPAALGRLKKWFHKLFTSKPMYVLSQQYCGHSVIPCFACYYDKQIPVGTWHPYVDIYTFILWFTVPYFCMSEINLNEHDNLERELTSFIFNSTAIVKYSISMQSHSNIILYIYTEVKTTKGNKQQYKYSKMKNALLTYMGIHSQKRLYDLYSK